MPEFVLDTALDQEGWKALPAFVQGYIEAAFFGDLRTDTLGGRLSRDAKSFGSQDLYLGDDGKVHVS